VAISGFVVLGLPLILWELVSGWTKSGEKSGRSLNGWMCVGVHGRIDKRCQFGICVCRL